MDLNQAPSENSEIQAIKKCLIDFTANMIEIKQEMKQRYKCLENSNQTKNSLFEKLNSIENFEKFDKEITDQSESFNDFMQVLNKIYSLNEVSIKKSMNIYFKVVLNAVFSKILIQKISWAKFRDNFSVKDTKIIHAIQQSGSIIDPLSTEHDRMKTLQTEFRKCKDAKRTRKPKQLSVVSPANEQSKFCMFYCLILHLVCIEVKYYFFFPSFLR